MVCPDFKAGEGMVFEGTPATMVSTNLIIDFEKCTDPGKGCVADAERDEWLKDVQVSTWVM